MAFKLIMEKSEVPIFYVNKILWPIFGAIFLKLLTSSFIDLKNFKCKTFFKIINININLKPDIKNHFLLKAKVFFYDIVENETLLKKLESKMITKTIIHLNIFYFYMNFEIGLRRHKFYI